jgi:Secretion system C-terminal sorting domain/Pregnancy-associated plasma protein-A
MKLKSFFTIVVVLFTTILFAQQRTCGTPEKMEQIMADPILKQQYLERQAKFQIELNKLIAIQAVNGDVNSARDINVTKRIPVAVHFPSVSNSSSAAIKTCLRNLAQSQVNVINADYNASNTDISNWTTASTFYPGVNVGNLDVQFELATQNHPTGTGLTNGTVAVTFGTDFLGSSDTDATWSGYMNFVVKDIGSNLLGYSPYPGSPSAGETVVMNTTCFGKGAGCSGYVPVAPFNLGRTVTHELGHFFNLDHTFANDDGCGTDDDGIADTPKVGNATYQCPANGSVNGCVANQKALTMNYMDYVDDPCMFMFTAGQKTVMLAYLNSIFSQFHSNALGTNDFVENNFSVFPNPNKGSFNIQFSKLTSDYSVEVFDLMGRIVYNNDFNQASGLVQTINLENTTTGIYFANIKSGNVIITKKIIVE